jgi:hypothetical protein
MVAEGRKGRSQAEVAKLFGVQRSDDLQFNQGGSYWAESGCVATW